MDKAMDKLRATFLGKSRRERLPIAAYGAPDRHYHNFKHIGLMMDNLEYIYKPHLSEREYAALFDAILYHDIIYDARRDDNEASSAQQYLNDHQGQSRAFNSRVVDLIMATKDHCPPKSDYSKKVIVDLDLAGLASRNYIRHSKQIRKEYAHATDLEWYCGRRQFLETFLSKPHIYHTDYGRWSWEYKAREYMALELNYILAKLDAIKYKSVKHLPVPE